MGPADPHTDHSMDFDEEAEKDQKDVDKSFDLEKVNTVTSRCRSP